MVCMLCTMMHANVIQIKILISLPIPKGLNCVGDSLMDSENARFEKLNQKKGRICVLPKNQTRLSGNFYLFGSCASKSTFTSIAWCEFFDDFEVCMCYR